MSGDLVRRDKGSVWHPLTQHGLEGDPLPVVRAFGSKLVLDDGRELIDAIASWWCCLHGHGRAELVEAIARQARTLDHVLLAGATHEPAVALAERLLGVAPRGLSRVFYSDDGSTAIEVALKMAIQRHAQCGEANRRVFIAFDGGYHGDTFGAMAVSDPDPYFVPFSPLCFETRRVPLDVAALASALEELGDRAAGIVLEPLVQGAAGMRMHDAGFVVRVRELATAHRIPFIADEVMTGFGRTGSIFACGRAGVTPDLMCVSKGLTGGMLPLAATLATEEFFAAFVAEERRRAFFHGHTFTGNPIACAVALASLELVLKDDVPKRLDAIGSTIESALAGFAKNEPRVKELRRLGGIVALELHPSDGAPSYFDSRALAMRKAAIECGVLLRPLGNVIYALPPACLDEDECARVAWAMQTVARVDP